MKRIVLLVELVFLMLMPVLVVNAQYTQLPYFNGFESQQDTAGWIFKKAPRETGFCVGNAVHCLGSKSLYISPDSGRTAIYSAGTYVSIAYTSFTLSAGTYTLSFDCRLSGDETSSTMKVAWSPDSVLLIRGLLDYPDAIKQYQFIDDNNDSVFYNFGWRHITGTVTVPIGGGTYNLCFAFRSIDYTVSALGACIDNIQLDTVKNSNDCTMIPTNIVATKDSSNGIIINWSGNATQYEIIAASVSNTQDTTFCKHTGILSTSDTIHYSELNEGQYFIYVRAICGSDTSMYGELSGVVIYDASAHGINFVDFNASGTQCTIGSYYNPYQTIGYVDNGPSAITSTHTVHTDLGEFDPRTDNTLHTIPEGEIMSVRLGNWNDSTHAESISYTYRVPSGSAMLIQIKYAVVLELAAHYDEPEFLIELLDTNQQLLDTVCGKACLVADRTQNSDWHHCSYYVESDHESTTVYWKDWTTLYISLTKYAGKTIKIRFTTKDCGLDNHFGYGYFIVDCIDAGLTKTAVAAGTEYRVPEGFNGEWHNICTNVYYYGETVIKSDSDSCGYYCICSPIEDEGCDFYLFTNTLVTNSNIVVCQNELPSWAVGTAVGGQCFHTDTLKTSLGQDSIANTVLTVLPVIHHFSDAVIPANNSYLWHGDTLSNAGTYLDTMRTIGGCDSVVHLNLTIGNSYHFKDSMRMQKGDSCNWRGKTFFKAGIYNDSLKSINNIDSIYTLVLIVPFTITVLSNDTTMGNVSGGGVFDYGENVLLTAMAMPHYHFVNWSNGLTTDTITVSVDGDTTLTANFAVNQHTVAVSSNDAAMGYVTGGGAFNYGDTVTLIATANPNCRFVSWSNGALTDTITVIVNSDTTLTANFVVDYGHSVVVNSNDSSADVYFYCQQMYDTAYVKEYHLVIYKVGGNDTANVYFSSDTSFVMNRKPRVIVIVDSVTGTTTTVTISINHATFNPSVNEVAVHLENLAPNSTYYLYLEALGAMREVLDHDSCSLTTSEFTTVDDVNQDTDDFFPTDQTDVYTVDGHYIGKYYLDLPPGIYLMRHKGRWHKFGKVR